MMAVGIRLLLDSGWRCAVRGACTVICRCQGGLLLSDHEAVHSAVQQTENLKKVSMSFEETQFTWDVTLL